MVKVRLEDNNLLIELSVLERILCLRPRKYIRIPLNSIVEIIPFRNVRVRYRILGLYTPGRYYGYFMTDQGLAFCIVSDPSRAAALRVANDRRFDLVAFNVDEETLDEISRRVRVED